MFVILNNGEMGTSSRARRSIIMFVMFVMLAVMFVMFAVMFVYQLSIGLVIASHVTRRLDI